MDCRCFVPLIVPDFSPVRAAKYNEIAIIRLQMGVDFRYFLENDLKWSVLQPIFDEKLGELPLFVYVAD